jgi:hypothetical protein
MFMNPLVGAFVVVFALCGAAAQAAPAAPKHVVVVFVADAAAGPHVVLEATSQGTKRTLRFSIVGESAPRQGALQDDGGAADAVARLWPQVPKGSSILEQAGGVVFTIDDAGPWQAAAPAPEPGRRAGKAVPPVPVRSLRSLRLVLDAPAALGMNVPATLHGAQGRVSGQAVLLPPDSAGMVVVRPIGQGLVSHVVDGIIATDAACGGQSASLVTFERGGVRGHAQSVGGVACGAVRVAAVAGAFSEARADVPIFGVLLTRDPGSPSAKP